MENNEGFDAKAPLKSIDRTKICGFMKYFSQRTEHFLEIFKMEYSHETAELAFDEANTIRKNLNKTIFSIEDM